MVARGESEVRAAEQRRVAARAEQLKQAFLMAEADARASQLEEFLARLDQSTGELAPSYRERSRVWIDVVRKELRAKKFVDAMLLRSLSAPSWALGYPNGGRLSP